MATWNYNGAVGQNFGEPVVSDANDLDEPKSLMKSMALYHCKEEDMTPLNTLDDEDIPF